MATLFSLKQGGMGFFLFKGAAITQEEIPDYDPATFDEIKSPSQRLRAVLFVVWKEAKGGKGDFENFGSSPSLRPASESDSKRLRAGY